MKKNTLWILITVLMYVFTAAGTSFAQKPSETKTPATPKNDNIRVIDGNLEIDFPEIDGWEASELTTYPTKELGFSTSYKNDFGATVTLYVYNGGRKSISSDLTKESTAELKKARGEIKSIAEMGYYDDVKDLQSDVKFLGNAKGTIGVVHTLVTFKVRGTSMKSHTYVFPYENHFIKIRATFPKDDKEIEESFHSLLDELDAFFAGNAGDVNVAEL